MGKWKYTIRKIRGVRRKVKVRKVGKREIVRVVNRRNYKDSTVPKQRLKHRKKNWVSYTDVARRVDHRRKKKENADVSRMEGTPPTKEYVKEFTERLHGSGIDTDWSIEETSTSYRASNSYHQMDEMGYYIGWADFTVIFPKKKEMEEFTLQFNGSQAQYIAQYYSLRDYLEDTILSTVDEVKGGGQERIMVRKVKDMDEKQRKKVMMKVRSGEQGSTRNWKSVGKDSWVRSNAKHGIVRINVKKTDGSVWGDWEAEGIRDDGMELRLNALEGKDLNTRAEAREFAEWYMKHGKVGR